MIFSSNTIALAHRDYSFPSPSRRLLVVLDLPSPFRSFAFSSHTHTHKLVNTYHTPIPHATTSPLDTRSCGYSVAKPAKFVGFCGKFKLNYFQKTLIFAMKKKKNTRKLVIFYFRRVGLDYFLRIIKLDELESRYESKLTSQDGKSFK